MKGVDISLAGGWIEVATHRPPTGEVVISMRPVSVFAKGPGSEIEQLRADLRGRWRQAARAVMVLLSLHGLPPSQIAELLDCHPATVRRWISRFNGEGLAGLADAAPVRSAPAGRAPADQPDHRAARPARSVDPAPYLPVPGWPRISARTLYRRVRWADRVAAQADRPRRPDHDHVGGPDRGPADRTAPPGRGARRGRDPPEPAAARAGQLDAARRPPAGPHPGHEPARSPCWGRSR